MPLFDPIIRTWGELSPRIRGYVRRIYANILNKNDVVV